MGAEERGVYYCLFVRGLFPSKRNLVTPTLQIKKLRLTQIASLSSPSRANTTTLLMKPAGTYSRDSVSLLKKLFRPARWKILSALWGLMSATKCISLPKKG
mmetsp:Transcript_18596/g.31649  ORF Transcript_18596/g.31649 Transcript_18596/m.31649 type:complete len:101 (+) Transcript_18596:317-619(+)